MASKRATLLSSLSAMAISSGHGASADTGVWANVAADAVSVNRYEMSRPFDLSSPQPHRASVKLVRAAGREGAEDGEGAEGGEGGEGTDLGGEAGFFAELTMMRGHLTVGMELLESDKPVQAVVHLRRPRAENYDRIATELESRGIGGLRTALERVGKAAQAGDVEATIVAQRNALQAIDDAGRTVEPSLRGAPDFIIRVALHRLDQAAHEYDEAIAGANFSEIEEYQDARGFVLVARALVESLSPILSQRDPERLARTRESFDELTTVWPSVTPPAEPVLNPSAVYGQAARIAFRRGGFHDAPLGVARIETVKAQETARRPPGRQVRKGLKANDGRPLRRPAR